MLPIRPPSPLASVLVLLVGATGVAGCARSSDAPRVRALIPLDGVRPESDAVSFAWTGAFTERKPSCAAGGVPDACPEGWRCRAPEHRVCVPERHDGKIHLDFPRTRRWGIDEPPGEPPGEPRVSVVLEPRLNGGPWPAEPWPDT
ncbi:MAG: hypothetical protein AAGH15_15625, partial [Myxococcota bacterium]